MAGTSLRYQVTFQGKTITHSVAQNRSRDIAMSGASPLIGQVKPAAPTAISITCLF